MSASSGADAVDPRLVGASPTGADVADHRSDDEHADEREPDEQHLAAGDVVTVTVTASNVGESDGTFTLEFTHGTTVVEIRDVTIVAGESVEELFLVTPSMPGLQTLSVNGVPVELDVYQLVRPGDGEVVVAGLSGGSNRLVIENFRDEDVYVVLTGTGEGQPPLLGVYVHAGSTQTVRGIPSGSYATFFVHGSDWCAHYRRFTSGPDYGRFDDDSVFESSATTYTEVTLTFGSTDGWSPTSSMDPTDFPQS